MEIRPMHGADVAEICAIELQSPSPWNDASLRQELLREHGVQYLLVDCDTIVAWVAFQVLGPEAELLKIAVASDYRRRGLALFFLNEITKKLMEKGVEEIFLEVREKNTPASKLYEKIGFNKIGIRKNYYQKPQDNALLYKLSLVAYDE